MKKIIVTRVGIIKEFWNTVCNNKKLKKFLLESKNYYIHEMSHFHINNNYAIFYIHTLYEIMQIKFKFYKVKIFVLSFRVFIKI